MYMMTKLQGWVRDGLKVNMLASSPSFAVMKEATAMGEALAGSEPVTVPQAIGLTDTGATPPAAGAQVVTEAISPAVLQLISGMQRQITAGQQQSA